jgi:predicted transcriptional regulator of viral defense system
MQVKTEKSPLRHASDYVRGLAAKGVYSFTSKDARAALGASPAAVKLALLRLNREGIVASPARGFYVIVPPEYQSLGCLPADQFIPALMQRVDVPYYAGLLSAAEYHGAAHHRPQEFQVMSSKARRPLNCGRVRVVFAVRKHLGSVSLQAFNTPRGAIQVSDPESTALDLVGYQQRVGGLDNVITVIYELADKVDPQKLVVAAQAAPISWAQRLGHLLEKVGAAEKAAALKLYVKKSAKESVVLLPGAPTKQAHRDGEWKLIVNANLEPET